MKFVVVFDDGSSKVYYAPSWFALISHLTTENLTTENEGDIGWIVSITKLPEEYG